MLPQTHNGYKRKPVSMGTSHLAWPKMLAQTHK